MRSAPNAALLYEPDGLKIVKKSARASYGPPSARQFPVKHAVDGGFACENFLYVELVEKEIGWGRV